MLNRQIDTPLYEQIAEQLIEDIGSGVYGVGHKVPSVRHMSRHMGVSISTVTQAYAWLEDQGWLRARPQSGYYVRARQHFASERGTATPPLSRGEQPAAFTKSERINNMLQRLNQPRQINLGAAIPDPAILPLRQLQTHINKVSRFNTRQIVAYQFAPGLEGLRQQIAVRMRDVGVRCHQDDVVITNGCAEAVTLGLRAATQPGDLIAVESPCYYGILQIAAMLGLKIIEIPTDPATGISLDALQLALHQWPIKLIALTARYANPTGSAIPSDKQRRLVELAKQHDVGILEDDIYGELGFPVHRDQAPLMSVLKSYDDDGRVMYCSSFSKTLAAGLRVGWCLPGRWYQQVIESQTFTTFSASSLCQHALYSYLQNGQYDRHLRQLRVRLADNSQRFLDAIARYFPADTRVSEPQGGFILWVCLPAGVSALTLYQLADEHSISIVPGDLFSNTDHFDECMRLNCAVNWNGEVENALATLGKLVTQLARQ
ncbi:GntR family transcriptional regulator [Bacterioplanes sanyensis]|uniref:GntR family transcriptional regulator n=1 Tax=Bacterioplanes sanyensis TaxID=1249553 RepID=A0A222FN37_9GAMM|nr:PLP-dependent aminotransferase family protein [Bacterioplanes sanyensis]ASP40445.1 GntR family transcriptional regulator [Bacterioplanes sanyensis]